MEVKQIGIPTTLSSIGRKYVFKEWVRILKNKQKIFSLPNYTWNVNG
jgi:hypothetical protein